VPSYSLGEQRVILHGEGCFIAPDASLIGSVSVGPEASIWFGVVARADNDQILIGARCNVQDGTVLHVDPGMPLTLGANVSVGHNATLHGCSIGENCLVGMGSCILNGARIAPNTIVGAGALIPEGKRFPEGVLLIGSPARVARELTQEEIAWIGRTAEGYVQRARRYRAELQLQRDSAGGG
jgi:carbonic anhydrase/acetyltransferase-like protein (isoleucine patch superfamily)